MAFNSVFRERHKKIHLVGIGGIGMSGIARVLLQSGFAVSGSDLNTSCEIDCLRAMGARIFIGHDRSHLGDADVVVYSSAIAKDNPELKEALRTNIPLLKRATMLAELMRLRCGIAVSGAHGKTTTTSLIATLMHKIGLDPTVIIGGLVNHFGANAVLGTSQFMVAEADESDGTFLQLSPTIAVVTNIDAEHLDFYQGSIDEIKASFKQFINSLPFYGLAVVCLDDPHVRDILPSINRRVCSYGFCADAHYQATNLETKDFSTSFDMLIEGEKKGRFTINMVGRHNVLNSLAAIGVLEEIGIPAPALTNILSEFNGVKRRFTKISTGSAFAVIDDYAHHPTEIRAVLHAARTAFGNKKIRVLFQPHRFSRTRDLMDEFSACFSECDSLVISEIYPASENPIEGVTSQALINRIAARTALRPTHAASIDEGAERIAALTEKGDVVITLGAGSITTAAPRIVDLLHDKYGLHL